MSIVRLIFVAIEHATHDTLWDAGYISQFRFVTLSESLSTLTMLTLDSTVEMHLAIICSCMIFFPSFFKKTKASFTVTYSELVSRGAGNFSLSVLSLHRSRRTRVSEQSERSEEMRSFVAKDGVQASSQIQLRPMIMNNTDVQYPAAAKTRA